MTHRRLILFALVMVLVAPAQPVKAFAENLPRISYSYVDANVVYWPEIGTICACSGSGCTVCWLNGSACVRAGTRLCDPGEVA